MIPAFIQGLGPLELTIVLVILLLILGPKRLPAMGRSLGAGMREFKQSISSRHDADEASEESEKVEAVAIDRSSDPQPAGARAATVEDGQPLEGEVVPERR